MYSSKMTSELKYVELGVYEQVSDSVRISDPCYDLEVGYAGTLKNVLSGTWVGSVFSAVAGDWGKRNWVVRAAHVQHEAAVCDKASEILVGVDSGQAGIFDLAYYRAPVYGRDWYAAVCDLTIDNESGAGVTEHGVVSRSGFGDGGYVCKYAEVSGKIVAIEITFISSADFSEDEDEDEDVAEQEDNKSSDLTAALPRDPFMGDGTFLAMDKLKEILRRD